MRYLLAVMLLTGLGVSIGWAFKMTAIPSERGSMSCVAISSNYPRCFMLMREGDTYFATQIEIKP